MSMVRHVDGGEMKTKMFHKRRTTLSSVSAPPIYIDNLYIYNKLTNMAYEFYIMFDIFFDLDTWHRINFKSGKREI